MRTELIDAFEEWLSNPVTETLMALLDKRIQDERDAWTVASIDGGVCDPVYLAKVRERIEVWREIRHMQADILFEDKDLE